jgi:hypothetical protein
MHLVTPVSQGVKKIKINSLPNTQINPTGNNAGWFFIFAGCPRALFLTLSDKERCNMKKILEGEALEW